MRRGCGCSPGSTLTPNQASAGRFEANRDAADHVLDEDRVVVGLHRDVALVGALEQRVDRSRAGRLGQLDEFLDPDERGLPVVIVGSTRPRS